VYRVNYGAEGRLFRIREPSDDAVLFALLSHQSRRVARDFAVAESLTKDEREQSPVPVAGCRRLCVSGQPLVNVFRLDAVGLTIVKVRPNPCHPSHDVPLVPVVSRGEHHNVIAEGTEPHAHGAEILREFDPNSPLFGALSE
jgi:hypothetical protein